MATRLEQRLAEQRKGKGSILKKLALGIGALLIFITAAGGAYLWFGGGLNPVKRTTALTFTNHKVNVLVLGVDERHEDNGRSDTMFVVTIDTDTKDVAMLSVPRDTRVKIPGHGWDKINHAYAYGKQDLSQKAVEELLGIPIDYYVVVNFASFYKIVDAVGGVDINVEKRMSYNDPYDDDGGLEIDLKPGMQHMDGKTAIKYVRYRDEEGDIGRIERQQKFIKSMLLQVTSPSVIVRVPSIIKEVSSSVKTNMSTAEMVNLAKILNDAQKVGFKTDMVPGQPSFIDDISYWLPDIVSLREHIAQIQGGKLEGKALLEAERNAIEYKEAIPKEMKVVEVPKTVDKDDKDKDKTAKPGEKPGDKPADKTADASKQPAKPPVPGRITVAVINASGNPAAGAKIAAELRAQGLEVASVSNSSSVANDTVVVSYTTSSTVVNKLTGLPFKYVLQITRDDGKSTSAAVIIGKDNK